MRLAFVFQCHKMTPSLQYTINKLSSDLNCMIIIHVDLKSNIKDFQSLQKSNVTLIEDRVNVVWGGYSQLKVLEKLLSELFRTGFEFDYVSFCSGDDIFHRSLSEFRYFLNHSKGYEFVGVSKEHCSSFKDRYTYRYPKVFFNRYPTGTQRFIIKFFKLTFKLGLFKNKSKPPFKEFYKGSNWFTVSNSFSKHLLGRIQDNTVRNYFLDSFCCDEVIVQSTIVNSHFKSNLYNVKYEFDDNKQSLRYIDWNTGPDFPKVFDFDDLNNIPNDVFFIRKVNEKYTFDDISDFFDES